MPDGYTIPEFVESALWGKQLASGAVILGGLFGSLIEVIINLKGTRRGFQRLRRGSRLAALVGLGVVLIYCTLGGLGHRSRLYPCHPFAYRPPAIIVVAALTMPVGPTRSGLRSLRKATGC